MEENILVNDQESEATELLRMEVSITPRSERGTKEWVCCGAPYTLRLSKQPMKARSEPQLI